MTYAAKIEKAEAAVDWARPSAEVARHVNGLSPFPGAWITFGGRRLKLLRAVPVDGAAGGAPGTVMSGDGLRVAAASGAVDVLEVQPEGRGRMTATEWRRGATVAAGERLRAGGRST